MDELFVESSSRFGDLVDDDVSWATSSHHVTRAVAPAAAKPYDVVQAMWIFGGPVIFVTGIFGNVLVLVVMTRRRMKGTSTSVHLSLMAVADACVLVTGLLPEWFEAALDFKFKEYHWITCKLEKFLFYTSADTSIWILVIFTLDRFVAICFPFLKKDCCRQSRAKFYALVAALTAVVKNLHVFWTRGPEYGIGATAAALTGLAMNSTVGELTLPPLPLVVLKVCGRPTPEYAKFEKFQRPWIVFVTVNAVPFCVILVCNVFIISALFEVRRIRVQQSIVSTSGKL